MSRTAATREKTDMDNGDANYLRTQSRRSLFSLAGHWLVGVAGLCLFMALLAGCRPERATAPIDSGRPSAEAKSSLTNEAKPSDNEQGKPTKETVHAEQKIAQGRTFTLPVSTGGTLKRIDTKVVPVNPNKPNGE